MATRNRLCHVLSCMVRLSLVVVAFAATAVEPDFSMVPGVVIDHSPASSGIYVGSPSIAVLPGGEYVASHDEFGPKSAHNSRAISYIFRSGDKGVSWKRIARVEGAFWGSLFVHRNDLYLLSTTKEYGNLVIRRSNDGGETWTEPRDSTTGLLAKGKYHCAPCPIVSHNGRLWRAYEDASGPGGWGACFLALMLSVPENSDLLDASQWTSSNRLERDPKWLDGTFHGWLEGNAVVTPQGQIVDILRVQNPPAGETAAVVRISADGKTATFDSDKDFIHFPGGTKKFTIRFDPQSKLYWTLSNALLPQDAGRDPGGTRNTLALMSSPDLRNWTITCYLLHHPDRQAHAFQYVDWLFDGDDIIAASRTAFEDGLGGAHRAHDANLLTFHRFKNFRTLTLKDSVPISEESKAVLESADFTVTAVNAEAGKLDDGARAFSNRDYVWEKIPDRFKGWRYTQTAGGSAAVITVVGKKNTMLYAATAPSQKLPNLDGWTAVNGATFVYTDKGRTAMQVYERKLAAGEAIVVPQGSWSGMIVLLP